MANGTLSFSAPTLVLGMSLIFQLLNLSPRYIQLAGLQPSCASVPGASGQASASNYNQAFSVRGYACYFIG